MSAIWIVMAAALVLGALRLRMRLSGLVALGPNGPTESLPEDRGPDGIEERWVLASAPGVEVDDDILRDACSYAAARRLEVLDLVPRDLRVGQVLELADEVNLTHYRNDRLARGTGVRQATLIERGVLDRLDPRPDPGEMRSLDPLAYAALMRELKAVASDTSDFVLVPSLRERVPTAAQKRELLRARVSGPTVYGSVMPTILAMRAAGFVLGALGLWLRPLWGVVAVAAYCAQPAIVTVRTGLRPADRWWVVPLRWAVGPALLVLLAFPGRPRGGEQRDENQALSERRAVYDELLSEGLERFFEPKRDTCPWCGSDELRRVLSTRDLYQHKPGRFTMDRCRSCGHIFQNRRLSEAGLGFYYLDFYDGLGESILEDGFATSRKSYEGRIALLATQTTPKRWLDVGAGHGHFCAMARERWPEALFEGLDLGESVQKAVRRRWVDAAYQGQFPSLADQLADRYDVVSMHHYLEHTTDPRAEIDAAVCVLTDGGHLLIELPDPDYALRKVLRGGWIPYLQPQHLHLVGLNNLKRALEERGFVVVAEECGAAHQPNDLIGALYLQFSRLATPPGLPWRPPSSRLRAVWHATLMTVMLPLLVLCAVADLLVFPFARHSRHGNVYRLVARLSAPKRALSAGTAA